VPTGSATARYLPSPGASCLRRKSSPVQVLADSAYGSADTRIALADAGHTIVIKPVPLNRAVPGGFTTDDFTVDTAVGTVICQVSRR